MRFMIIMRASEDTEFGVLPTENELAEMNKYNQELVDAGILRAGEGLHPSSKGVRVRLSPQSDPVVTDGPFAEVEELIAGFWIFEVDSLREAVDWVKRCPTGDGEINIEIRQLFENEDFGEEFTPELKEREQRMREQVEGLATLEERRTFIKAINQAWSENDMDVVIANLTDDVRWTMAGEFTIEGKDNFIKSIEEMNTEAMTTKSNTTDHIVVDGNRAIINGSMTMVDPDENESTYGFCDVYRLRGDKISAVTSYVVDLKS